MSQFTTSSRSNRRGFLRRFALLPLSAAVSRPLLTATANVLPRIPA